MSRNLSTRLSLKQGMGNRGIEESGNRGIGESRDQGIEESGIRFHILKIAYANL